MSTLHSLFECERALFAGLAIEPHWDWSEPHPVVHLDLSGEIFDEPGGVRECLIGQLDSHARRFTLSLASTSAPTRFAELLEALRQQTGRRVVVLVDEYDKPILDVLDDPDIARANRNYLRSFYAVIKRCDEHVRFCFLTGVSKFSKVSLFSGLNSLEDITLDPRFSSLCGYTESGPGSGTTATAGAARSASTTPSTCCCCSTSASSRTGGARRATPRS